MREVIEVLTAAVASLALVWIGLVVMLAVHAPRLGVDVRARDAVRLGPDVVRLVVRLVRDPAVPRRTRILLAVLAVYLLSPVDLIPDVVPVLGYADDAIVAALAVRAAVRRAGAPALERNWPGTPQGLDAVMTLAGVVGSR